MTLLFAVCPKVRSGAGTVSPFHKHPTTRPFQFQALTLTIWNTPPLCPDTEFQDNLTVNCEKTHVINFCLRSGRTNGFSIILDEAVVHLFRAVRFLGLDFNEGVEFRDHVELVTMKVSSGIFVICCLKQHGCCERYPAAYYGLFYPLLV